jgi:hypothetical protein
LIERTIDAPQNKWQRMDKELDTWKNGDKGPETGTSKIADCATKFQKLNEDH